MQPKYPNLLRFLLRQQVPVAAPSPVEEDVLELSPDGTFDASQVKAKAEQSAGPAASSVTAENKNNDSQASNDTVDNENTKTLECK